MNTKLKRLLLFGLLMYSSAKAQIVFKSVYDRYSPSVVSKVYQYAKQSRCNEAQQLKFAALIQEADSMLVENLKLGKPVPELDNANFTSYSQIYLDSYLAKIKSIKAIPEAAVQKIKQQFYAKSNKDLYADWGSVLLEATQFVLPDTAIFSVLYNKQIRKLAIALAVPERLNLIRIHHISKQQYLPVVKLLENKAYQLALIDYTYGAYGRKRDSLVLEINHYHDSVIQVALLKDGSLLNSSQFAIALKYKKALGIPEYLTDTLVYHAMYISQARDSILQKDPFAKTDFKAYESKYLSQLLTEDQYTKLLSIKNASQAKMDANEDWDDIEKRGIANELDKANTIDQLYKYYMAKWNTYYRFADNTIKQEANLQLLKESSPKALKMLNAAKKQPNPLNTNSTVNFKW
jgi:hypothetical protein